MSLKQTAFAAGRWTAASAVLVSALQLLQTAVLARLLLPSEFGLMAVAAALLAVISLVADLGLNQALIHYDNVPSQHAASMYWLNVLLATVLMILLIAAAPAVGKLYHSVSLVPVLQWASLTFPLTAMGQQMRALAQKELRFAVLARVEVGAAFVGLVAAVVVALLGGGVYALVTGIVVRTACSSGLAWLYLKEYRPSLHLRFSETRPFVRFGAFLVGEGLASALHRDLDVFIGGLVLSPAAMGVYSVPRDLSLRLAMIINPITTRVGFPVMSRVKDDRERLKSIYLQTLRMTASVNFPMYVALALFANEIVALLYGPRWHDAGMFLRILAAWGLIRSTGNPTGSLLYAVGKTKRAFWWNLALLALLPPLYWFATRGFGLTGLVISMLIFQIALVIPTWRLLVRPCCGVGLGEYLRQLVIPLWVSLAAGVLAWLCSHALNHGTLRLAVGCTVGGIAYLTLSWVFNRRWTNAMSQLIGLKLHRVHP